jgi:hypothetical protein
MPMAAGRPTPEARTWPSSDECADERGWSVAHRPSYLDGGAVADRLGSRLTIYGSGSLSRTAGRCGVFAFERRSCRVAGGVGSRKSKALAQGFIEALWCGPFRDLSHRCHPRAEGTGGAYDARRGPYGPSNHLLRCSDTTSGDLNGYCHWGGITKHVASPPDRLNVVLAPGYLTQLLP